MRMQGMDKLKVNYRQSQNVY